MNLNQLTVPSRNVAASVAFYQRLGLRLLVDAMPRYARLECPEGDTTFSLHQAENFSPENGIWLYFECADLDNRVRELQSAGIIFETEPTDQSWLWREARLRDPDGHQLILYHAGHNRKNPPWRVKADASK